VSIHGARAAHTRWRVRQGGLPVSPAPAPADAPRAPDRGRLPLRAGHRVLGLGAVDGAGAAGAHGSDRGGAVSAHAAAVLHARGLVDGTDCRALSLADALLRSAGAAALALGARRTLRHQAVRDR